METTQNLPQKLLSQKIIKGTIKVETGLHIGGSAETIEIGGMDNPIITNPVTKEPYIPGSSLKGKMRSLIEWKLGKLELDPNPKKLGQPYGFHPENAEDVKQGHPISRIFGTTADEAKLGPTRLIVRDAFISKDFRDEAKKVNPNYTWIDMIEEKTENAINRITARANPRPIQRVVTGTEFEFEMIYRIFDMSDNGDVDRKNFDLVLDGLKLIEMDALGGAGSRGCGKVSFWIQKNETRTSIADVSSSDFPEIKLT